MALTPHPYGVRPLGNLLNTTHNQQTRSLSLGSFSLISDALIIKILDSLIQSSDPLQAAITLSHFASASVYARAFANDEDLWRTLVWRRFSPSQIANAPFNRSWRHTYLTLESSNFQTSQNKPIVLSHVYSDVLFHKWRCLRSQISSEWTKYEDIQRIDASTLSVQDFQSRFERPSIPVILKGIVSNWKSATEWDPDSLIKRVGSTLFHAGGFEMSLNDYFKYSKTVEGFDDQPLYIFDKKFGEKAPNLLDDYSVPEYFSEDLFKVLGENRPDFRWLIIGPSRSGSSFHKDPNATSAWNAVIRGRKKWLMFPPDCPPPGVFPSGDEGDVTAPVSITEWFLNFYNRETILENGALECIVEEGEIIFVPMGWWHCVLNLETSIAITQNYVGSANVRFVTDWIQSRPSQISGCRDVHQAKFISQKFHQLIAKQFPKLAAREKIVATHERNNGEENLLKKRKVSLWTTLNTTNIDKKHEHEDLNGSDGNSKPFTFGF